MPTPRPKLSLVAEAGIQELRRDHGIEPTLDEIIWLHELGKAQEAAGRIDGILEAPAQAGNTFLWPVTIMASQWWRNYAMQWFKGYPLWSFYSFCFALAHGRGLAIPAAARHGWAERIVRETLDIRETRTLVDLQDRTEATEAIKAWLDRLGATKSELEAAFDFVHPVQDTPKKQNDDPAIVPPGVNYDDIVHQLATLSGTDPDYWRKRTSMTATLRAFINVVAIERARRGHNGPSVQDALGAAIQNFRNAMVEIIKAHKAEGDI